MFIDRNSQPTVDHRQDLQAGFPAWFECNLLLWRDRTDLLWILFKFTHAFPVQVLFSLSLACCYTAVRLMCIGRSSSTALELCVNAVADPEREGGESPSQRLCQNLPPSHFSACSPPPIANQYKLAKPLGAYINNIYAIKGFLF